MSYLEDELAARRRGDLSREDFRGDHDDYWTFPARITPALRMALYLRTTAIRQAREKELNGFILTSNGSRRDLDRLVDESGASGVTVLKMSEKQACAAVRRVVSGAERIAACEEGIKRRWFGRFQPSATDREVIP